MTYPRPLPDPRVVSALELGTTVSEFLGSGARLALVAGHHDPEGIRVVYTLLTPGREPQEMSTTVTDEDGGLPSLAALSYPAGRFEREVRDLYGVTPLGHPLPQRLVRHGHWPSGYYPMRHDATPDPVFGEDTGSFPFHTVQGDGVYEIPVGPVHAGLIEPGHFRFSVVGETILRVKARLWFVYRGVEKLFEGRSPEDGIALAERISGDTAVGHSLAYACAVEQALGIPCSEREALLRILLLELERLHNHIADIGAIVNDAGFGIVNAQTQVLRERLLRHNKHVTGHRLLRGAIALGSTTIDNSPDLALISEVASALRELVDIALDNVIVTDRLSGTSILPTGEGRRIGVLGYVARASGIRIDARTDHPIHPRLAGLEPVIEQGGDVLARFLVRAREAQQSAALIADLTRDTATGQRAARPGGHRAAAGQGLGVVEAWRGTLCHRVEIRDGLVSRCKVVDPSFFNWPAVPVALKDTIVPDFPLTNKSFNQSYAGNDL